MPVPPVAHYRIAAGPAYLLAWRQNPDGVWWGRLLWLDHDGDDTVRGADAWAICHDIQPIPGQDYSRVPRHRHTGPRIPIDLYDPRDPHHKDRDRPLRHRRPPPEPDF